MDFSNRPAAQQPQHNPQLGANPPVGAVKRDVRKKKNLHTWAQTALVGLVVLLVAAFLLELTLSRPNSQSAYVNNTRLQAVFLNTGQVYFGSIQKINPEYITLSNIFYLQTTNKSNSASTTGSNANTNVSLVKLGCELHAPFDQMVINMREVTFWENLHNSGQVGKAVASYHKQYPHGQACSNQSASSNGATSQIQNATGNSAPTSTQSTPAPTTTTTPSTSTQSRSTKP